MNSPARRRWPENDVKGFGFFALWAGQIGGKKKILGYALRPKM